MAGGTSHCSIQQYFPVVNQGLCNINDLKFDPINGGTASLQC